jgi:hypothetical protein
MSNLGLRSLAKFKAALYAMTFEFAKASGSSAAFDVSAGRLFLTSYAFAR